MMNARPTLNVPNDDDLLTASVRPAWQYVAAHASDTCHVIADHRSFTATSGYQKKLIFSDDDGVNRKYLRAVPDRKNAIFD